MKWLVFADAGADLVPEPFQEYDPFWSTKEEFDRAFPVLEPRRPYKAETEAFQDGVTVESYDASFEKALKGELSNWDACQALELINRVREPLVALSKLCHTDDTVTPLSEKQKKIKSPEQAKRLRDRQRLSRQRKRTAKTALRLAANSDSMSQTLDMTSEPAIETSSGNENNRVAIDQTIDNQLQEDFEDCLCYICRMTLHDTAWQRGNDT